jgi:group I intron endonuclease
MKQKCGIYTITNTVNNKLYVGYSITLSNRKWDHWKLLKKRTHPNIHLQRAWDVYGEENFMYEILVECEKEHLPSEEHYWATMLNVHDDNYGYNIKPTHPYGVAGLSEETKRKISVANSKRQDLSNKRKVLQFDLSGNFIKEWLSVWDVYLSTGLHYASITQCCKGLSNKSHGYIWKYKDKYTGDNVVKRRSNQRKIYQYDINNNLVAEFISNQDAALALNIRVGTISESLRTGWKAFGFYFKREKI